MSLRFHQSCQIQPQRSTLRSRSSQLISPIGGFSSAQYSVVQSNAWIIEIFFVYSAQANRRQRPEQDIHPSSAEGGDSFGD